MRPSPPVRRNILLLTFCGILANTSEAFAADTSGVTVVVPAAIVFVVGLLVGGAGAYYFSRGRSLGSISYGPEERKIFIATLKISTCIGAFALLGALTLVIVSLGIAADTRAFALTLGADLMVGAAASALGALFGFIFGVPRTLDPADRAAVAGAAAQGGRTAASSAVLAANTNLERVSDWLTTLLIGATLVQIKEVPGWIASLAEYVGHDNGITNQTLIPFVAVYFFGLAFLGVYLITRLYLTTALTQTLGVLAGGEGVPGLAVLRAKLSSALKASDADILLDAINFYISWPISTGDKDDPTLNADAARALAKYLSTGKADNASVRLEQLQAALKNAAADASVKAKLQTEFAGKVLTTGDGTKDAMLGKILQ